VDVTLSWHEILLGSDIGRLRQISSLRRGLKDKHGYDGDGWGVHIEGGLGELCVAKVLNVYYDGSIDVFQRADVGDLHVRTRSRHDYELIVRENDDPAARFVLVTGKAPKYRVRGWILGADAMKGEYLRSHGGREPAYFVPHSALHDISTLPGVTPSTS
jgi:hypothetical protein